MCPPWPRPKSVTQILIEVTEQVLRKNPELFTLPVDIDYLDYVGAD